MGYNSTVIVMNDSLSAIEKDPDFGKNLVRAIMAMSMKRMGEFADVSALRHINAATVVDCEHADYYRAILVGGNMGEPMGGAGTWSTYLREMDKDQRKEYHLKELARSCGYRLVKRPKRK